MYLIDRFDPTFRTTVIYALFHKATKKFTLGFTTRPSSALRLVHWQLLAGTHKNAQMRELAREDNRFYHVYYPVGDACYGKVLLERLIELHTTHPDYVGRLAKDPGSVMSVNPEDVNRIVNDLYVGGEKRWIPRVPRKNHDFPGFNTMPLPVKFFKYATLLHTPTQPADLDDTSAAYIIYLPSSKDFYLGSTGRTV